MQTNNKVGSGVTKKTFFSTFADNSKFVRVAFFLATTLLCFGVYFSTVSRTVNLVDSGELIIASLNKGVPHPSGFPTFLMFMHLFSFLTNASSAFAVNIISAVFASLGGGLFFLIACKLNSYLFSEKISFLKIAIFSCFSALFFSFSLPFWLFATVTEVYALNMFLILGMILSLFYFFFTSKKIFLIAAAILFGASLGNQHLHTLFCGFFILIMVLNNRKNNIVNCAIFGVVAIVTTVLAYAYLYYVDKSAYLLNWGGIHDFQSFWRHISAAQYQMDSLKNPFTNLFQEGKHLFWSLFINLFPTGVVLAYLGNKVIYKKNPQIAWALCLALLSHFFLGVSSLGGEDKEAYFICFLLFANLFVSSGFIYVYSKFSPKSVHKNLVFVAAFASAMLLFISNYSSCDRSKDTRAVTLVNNILTNVPPNSLILTEFWHFYSPYMYMHYIENFRPDVNVIDTNLLKRSWYVALVQKMHANLNYSLPADKVQNYLEKLKPFENHEPFVGEEIQAAYENLMFAIIDLHVSKGNSVFITVPNETNFFKKLNGLLWGLTIRLSPSMLEIQGLQTSIPPWTFNYPVTELMSHKYDLAGNMVFDFYGQAFMRYNKK